MDVAVMVERINDSGFRATAMMPVPLVAEAPTRDQAVDRIRALIGEKMSGAELIHVTVPTPSEVNPWLAIAGTWHDSPEVDEVAKNIEAYRRDVDADASRP